MKRSLCLALIVCTLFAALLLTSHPVWGVDETTLDYRIYGDSPNLWLDDTTGGTEGEWGWNLGTDSAYDQAFSIKNDTTGAAAFVIEKDAGGNLLFLDGDGRIGINTNNPLMDLDIQSTLPAVRLNDTDSVSYFLDLRLSDTTFSIGGSSLQNIVTMDIAAPANSLNIDSSGEVGIGTTTPDAHLEVRGAMPRIRLKDTTSGAGHGGLIMFGDTLAVQGDNGNQWIITADTGAPANSLNIDLAGNVGIGTATVETGFPFEIQKSGANAGIHLERAGGAKFKINATPNQGQFGTRTDHKLNIVTNNANRMTIATNGYVGISDSFPSHPLDMGTLGNEAHCTTGGVWTNGSSRASKENIKSLSADEAMNALEGLTPVTFNYKAEKQEDYVGFIAEDVPELVATNDRKTLSSMDIVAVLARVTQEQQKVAREQQRLIQEQQKAIAELSGEVRELKKELSR